VKVDPNGDKAMPNWVFSLTHGEKRPCGEKSFSATTPIHVENRLLSVLPRPVTTITARRTCVGLEWSMISLKRKFLFISLGVLALVVALTIYSGMQVRATTAERGKTLPGDDLIPQPIGAVNHAVTIHRSPHEVWPWLVQMGSGRAGWYAYDLIDNGRHPSADRILPEYQDISVGSVLPAIPGAKDVFVVAECEPERSLVLSWRLPNGRYQTTWAFVLEQTQPDETRLIVRWPRSIWLSPLRFAAMVRVKHWPNSAFHHATQAVTRDRSPRRRILTELYSSHG
jgi:hypothetical protein